MIVRKTYLFIDHWYIVVMDFGAIVLEPGDQLHFKELTCGGVMLLIQKKVGLMEDLNIIYAQH